MNGKPVYQRERELLSFLQKERFLAGLSPVLQEKVKGKFLESFEEDIHWDKAKDRKLQFQSGLLRREMQPLANEQQPQQPPPAPPVTPKDPHLELLQRVTNQLDNLSINLVQGLGCSPNPAMKRENKMHHFCEDHRQEGRSIFATTVEKTDMVCIFVPIQEGTKVMAKEEGLEDK